MSRRWNLEDVDMWKSIGERACAFQQAKKLVDSK
jgi:hypothetical protein